ncbi:MAG: LacI family transcriptional regulator [Planctomycetota bacterium]|nr:LacI family transcriptional regulator [Planctomycetota bacterium]
MAKPKRSLSKPARRLSLSDVADAAGVSKATVSLVLNGRSREVSISEATRRRVLEVARQVDYRPRVPEIYRSQVSRMLRQISLLFVNPTGKADHEFLAPAFMEIAMGASEAGLLVHTTQGMSPQEVPAYCLDLKDRDSEGLILFTFDYEPPEWLEAFSATGIPYVVFNRDFGPRHPGVVMDHQGQAAEQVGLLLEAGHRRIACFGKFATTSLLRREGYRQRMRRAGLYDAELEFESPYNVERARAAGLELLRRHPGVTGVFCTLDLIALGLLRAARDAGRRVPEDLSVVSMDGYQFGEHSEPPLSTIRYPLRLMGRAALKLLRDRVAGEDGPTPVVIRGERVPGGCVAPPH